MAETEPTDYEFGEELKKYEFRDWRFEPVFISGGCLGLTDAPGVTYRSLGVRIWYVAEDNRFPGSGRMISLHITRFFDPASAVRSKNGWTAWVRDWLWGHIRWILDHEAREQFFYDGALPFDPHAATGGTLPVPRPAAVPTDQDAAEGK